MQMQTILSRNAKELMKQKIKSDKLHGKDETSISMIEANVFELQQSQAKLKAEIFRDEGTYLSVARDKREKKLKAGVNEKYIKQCHTTVDGTRLKIEENKNILKAKIEQLESDKRSDIDNIDAKIEKLEREKRQLLEKTDSKISLIEAKSESTQVLFEKTIMFHQSQIDTAYEEIPVVVTFPASHHKKMEELKIVTSQIESSTQHILAMKAAEFDCTPREDERLVKLREQSAREDAEALRLARQEQYDNEVAENLARKAKYKADERRANARHEERAREKALKEKDENS